MDRLVEFHKLQKNLTFLGKVGLLIHGSPFVGGFIRGLYLKRFIKGIDFKYVLDAGCGGGNYAFYIARKYRGVEIDACDIDGIDGCKELQDKLGIEDINFFQQDLLELDRKEKYDLIYSIDALEHIRNNREALVRFYNSLRPRGYLLVHMPQRNWHEINIFNPTIFKKHNKTIKEKHVGEHYTMDQLVQLIERIGFKIARTRKTFGFWGKLAWELDQILQEKGWGRLKAITLPLIKCVGRMDLINKNKKGGGILILAQKEQQ